MMVVDTSIVIAVINDEPVRDQILASTADSELIAPESLYWEVGNAFSAMFRRHLIDLYNALTAVRLFLSMDIRRVPVDLEEVLRVAWRTGIYAYDAYMIQCALNQQAPLITLDRRLAECASQCDVQIVEVSQ